MPKALVVCQVNDTQSLEPLMEAVKSIDSEFDLLSVSSVYQLPLQEGSRKRTPGQGTYSHQLNVGISLEVVGEPKEVLEQIKEKEEELRLIWRTKFVHCSLSLYLVFLSNQNMMLPSIYIPHPDFVYKKDWMLIGAELWPEFVHPILNEKLSIVARDSKIRSSDYFFAQGKKLLDFPLADS
ncbi:MAG: hypothetical protein AB8E15_11115 [Bdellovibrionales bacterium]